MYHGIVRDHADIPADREIGAELYDVDVGNFREQMAWLRGKEVQITFDDGEYNNLQHALPILREHGLTAIFFIAIEHVGKKGYMTWEHIRELRDAGMEMGSHGLTHRILTSLKKTEMEKELYDSKDILEHQLNVDINSFSVPRGFFNDEILRIAQEAGYKKIYVSEALSKNPHCLGRIAVRKSWDLRRFQMAVEGQVPMETKISSAGKKTVQTVVGVKGYDRLRSLILKLKGGKKG